MLIYGVCEESITKYNEDKAEKFLKNLLDTSCKDIAENYFINNGFLFFFKTIILLSKQIR